MHPNRTGKLTDLSPDGRGPSPHRRGFIRKWLRFFEPATPAVDAGGTAEQAADLEALRVENTKRASSLFNRLLPLMFFLGIAFATGILIAVIAFDVVLVRMVGSARPELPAVPSSVYAALGLIGPTSAAVLVVRRRTSRRRSDEPTPEERSDDSAVAS